MWRFDAQLGFKKEPQIVFFISLFALWLDSFSFCLLWLSLVGERRSSEKHPEPQTKAAFSLQGEKEEEEEEEEVLEVGTLSMLGGASGLE